MIAKCFMQVGLLAAISTVASSAVRAEDKPAAEKVVIALGEPKFAAEGKDAHGLAVTPDGKELWLTTQTNDLVTVLSVGGHKVLAQVKVGQDPNWIGFTPDGMTAVVGNTGSGDVSLVDVKTRKVTGTVKVGKSPKRLAVGSVVTPSARYYPGVEVAH